MTSEVEAISAAIINANKIDVIKDVLIPIITSAIAVSGAYLLARSQDRNKSSDEVAKNVNFLFLQCFEARCELITLKEKIGKTLSENPYTRFTSVADVAIILKNIETDPARWDYLTPRFKCYDDFFHIISFTHYNAFAGNYARMIKSIEYVIERSTGFIHEAKSKTGRGVEFSYELDDLRKYFGGDLTTVIRETEQAIILIDTLILYTTLFIKMFPVYVKSKHCSAFHLMKGKSIVSVDVPEISPHLKRVDFQVLSRIFGQKPEDIERGMSYIYCTEEEKIKGTLADVKFYRNYLNSIEVNETLLHTLLSEKTGGLFRVFVSILLIPVFFSALLILLFFFPNLLLK
jgi:hypothetical protein